MSMSAARKFYAGLAIMAAFLFPTTPVFAAKTFFGTNALELQASQLFKIDVYINTEDASVNALEGKVIFPQDMVELQRLNDADSIISFWIDRPKHSTAGQIAFSGIIPGGFVGARGHLFSATFLAKKEGRGAIELRGVRALRNDGLGTAVPMTVSRLSFQISTPTALAEDQVTETEPVVTTPTLPDTDIGTITSQPEVPIPDTNDDTPPEIFTPQLTSDESIFDDQWFVVFATQDKGSGIDRYEVCEGKKKCVVAASPHLLSNQSLDTEIIVKAFDKNGNVREVTLPARNGRTFTFVYVTIAVLIAVMLLAVVSGVWRVFRGRGRRSLR